MVNEEQLLEAFYATSRYYEKKYKEATNDYDKERYMIKLARLDVAIFDLESGKKFDRAFWGYRFD